jgi:hypothetical protein
MPPRTFAFAALALTGLSLVTLAACASRAEDTATDDDPLALESTGVTACTRPMKPATRIRKVVVTHPYTNGDDPKKLYEVLDLHTDGHLVKTGTTFVMGAAGYTPITFTPDGEIGIVVQNDYTLGVFRFDESGHVQVVDAGVRAGCLPQTLVMSPNGDKFYALDPDTANNGGGIYELDIDCSGNITRKGLVVPGGGANALAFMPGSRTQAIYAGIKAFDAADGNDTFLLDMRGPSLKGQGSTFGTTPGIASSLAITTDGKYALVTDDSIKAGNRVGVITLGSMKPRQILPTKAPFQVVPSIYNNAALVVNGDAADELSVLSYDPSNDTTPFAAKGDVPYTLPRPQLPGAAVQITRGSLKGRVLVAELSAVRQVQFNPDGTVTDVDQVTWDETNDGVIGTVGVQP